MSSRPQSRDKRYAFPPAPVKGLLDKIGWDETMYDICERLISLEAQSADYDAVVDKLKGQALEVITNSLTTEIDDARAQLAALRTAYDEIEAEGVKANRVFVSAIPGFPSLDVQAALAELVARAKANAENIAAVTTSFNDYKNAQRLITGAAVFFGGI